MNTLSGILQLPFIQVALPIMVTFVVAILYQNKRLDDMRSDFNRRFDDLKSDFNRRFDDVFKRLDRIELKLENHNDRITRLEERTSLIR